MADCLKKGDLIEVKSMNNPPADVKEIITITLMLLGHSEQQAQEWRYAKKVISSHGFLEQMAGADVSKLDAALVEGAKKRMESIELARLSCVSKSAAAFGKWCMAMVSAC